MSRLDLLGPAAADDLDVAVECSSGTYVRALARDLGAALGVGGHLTALRRTRVGPFTWPTRSRWRSWPSGPTRCRAAGRRGGRGLPAPRADADEADGLSHGGRLDPTGRPARYGAFGPDGRCIALVEDRDGAARPLVVFRAARSGGRAPGYAAHAEPTTRGRQVVACSAGGGSTTRRRAGAGAW